VVIVFALASGITPTLGWLALIPLVGLLTIFAVGLAMMLSALYVRFRDVAPIWDVALQVTFYASLILVPYEAVKLKSEAAASALIANPLAAVIQESRHMLIDPSYVSASSAIGSPVRLLVPFAVLVGTFLLGLWVFNREAPRIAEEL
jgi:ABC-2 type transport system permease protein